ncbi:FHA domain-containing protein, partial [Chitiniphilus eburneus]
MARVLLCLDGNVIKEVRLVRDRTTVGRRPSNDIQIENLAVSGEHAMFNRVGRDVFIEDLGSTNGTLVNGKPVQRQLLDDGDEVVVGKYQLKFWRDADSNDDFEKTMMLQAPTRPIPPPAPRTAAVVSTRPTPVPDVYVLELSSFQLETTSTLAPDAAT